MKSLMLIISFGVLLIFLSCKKEASSGAMMLDSDKSIVGTWELRQIAAAMNPLATNYTPGNGNLLTFTADKYEVYKNGQLASRGSYKIVPDSTVNTSVCLTYPEGQFTNRIDFQDSVLAFKQFIQITGDTLYIVAGCYALDAGHSAKYVRFDKHN
ncbi:MAG: hypothetical protein JST75_17875 [Bacteroidetes bacterium]|nr:hypothetical protein [Bacteroidota bacterium]